MYVKKITSFCQVLKRYTQEKIGSFFLSHGVYYKNIMMPMLVLLRNGSNGSHRCHVTTLLLAIGYVLEVWL